jgi:hypothetical protein
MNWIKSIAAELFGLFVDDIGFAVAILAWIAAVWLLMPFVPVPMALKGPILFAGLGIILVESATRRARK